MLREIFAVARKEFRGFFASPAAFIFIGGFLAVALFTNFWVESFFARNIADLRPMFKWMPVLMVFLAGALTMRVWAEERRGGTLETLLTTPVRLVSLVIGKFLAVEALVALALLLTVPLPLTVAHLGALDWGPVVGGYVATLCLAAAYVSIGLFVSAGSENAVVSLIVTVLICAAFYFIGSDLLTGLFSRSVADVLDQIGTGARFDSITRGVLDLRDLYYYLSILGTFLALNVLQLHRLRWAGNPGRAAHRATAAVSALAVANLLVANFWLAPVTEVRADLTSGHRYTLSDATRTALGNLQEPLTIRGYFSSKTHPLLAPLVPNLRDLLSEYAVAGGSKVHVEFVNPTTDPAAEKSAAEFGIQPTPFQTANRQSASVVNSYFDILVAYGGQTQTLGFRDLIAAKNRGGTAFDVGLANPEYAITSAIRKVTQTYAAGGNAYAAIPGGVTLHGYISPADKLPDGVKPLAAALTEALKKVKDTAADSFNYAIEDPQANGGALAKKLGDQLGLGPQIASVLDPQPFWFSLVLQGGDRSVPVALPPTGKLDAAAFERAIDSASKRLAPGFLRTIALATPKAQPAMNPMMPSSGPQYSRLRSQLGQNARVIDADLSRGIVPEDTDVLMVLAPDNLGDKERFAIDQFLMKGGAVVLATSPFKVDLAGTLSVDKAKSGLSGWLKGYGITIGNSLVMDPQSASLPIPVERKVGGLSLRQIQMMPYPQFPDIRGYGLSPDSPITSQMSQLTLDWASPVTLAKDMPKDISAIRLVTSSSGSWTSAELNVLPDYRLFPRTGFAVEGKHGAQLLAVALTGKFRSAFADGTSPLLTQPDSKPADGKAPPNATGSGADFAGVIEQSADSAKLVVVAAGGFATDLTLQLASQGAGTDYTAPVDFLQNVADWGTQDPALLSLRGRTQYANTLRPLSLAEDSLWEYLNYACAALGLGLVWLWRRWVRARDRVRYARILNEVTA